MKDQLAADPGTLAFSIKRRENAAVIAFAPAKLTISPREFTARNAPGFNSAKAEAIAFLRGLFGKAARLKVTDGSRSARRRPHEERTRPSRNAAPCVMPARRSGSSSPAKALAAAAHGFGPCPTATRSNKLRQRLRAKRKPSPKCRHRRQTRRAGDTRGRKLADHASAHALKEPEWQER